ncbi:MAG: hypothetical protein IPF98_22655 [Gemmatimonadetes bacterium]|nr:hypothetical protein [Gemmatimonadota bacterium]
MTAVEGVDWIERRRPSGGVSTIWGAELSRASREIALRDARGQRHRLQLLAFGVRGGLEVDGQEFRFDDPEEVHDQRLRRALRMGTDVGVLDAGGALSPGLARCIRFVAGR